MHVPYDERQVPYAARRSQDEQASHAELPVPLNCCGGHDVQDVAPAEENLPEGQNEHEGWPMSLYLPASHSMHAVAAEGEYLPAGHDMQPKEGTEECEMSGEIVPAGQNPHMLLPMSTLPAKQAKPSAVGIDVG